MVNENTHITKKRYACFRFNALFIFSIKDPSQTRQLNICHSAVLTSISNVIINSLPASVKPTIKLGEKDATCTLYLRRTRSKHRITAGRTESYYYNTCGKINKSYSSNKKADMKFQDFQTSYRLKFLFVLIMYLKINPLSHQDHHMRFWRGLSKSFGCCYPTQHGNPARRLYRGV